MKTNGQVHDGADVGGPGLHPSVLRESVEAAAGGLRSANDLGFLAHESEVRYYSRAFPVVFTSARGIYLFDETNRSYIDFFSGAGALNYGHNNPTLKAVLLDYIAADGLTQGLDMATKAKRDFIEAFERLILAPRGLSYRLQFTGPTGAHAVEAALALARKVTGRTNVVSFTNGFHGVTQGALSLTANRHYRNGRARNGDVVFLPYDGYANGLDAVASLEEWIVDPGSGMDPPAAFVVETVQGEGGVNVASVDWLQRLASSAKRMGSLLIVDDIQVGNGRTGPYFSFERAGIVPDLVCLSKSLSGYGLPMSLALIRPDLDVWSPGEHNGTFRGNNLAFVTARAALELYWKDGSLAQSVAHKADAMQGRLEAIAAAVNRPGLNAQRFVVRGCGLIQGLDCRDDELASRIARSAFERGLIIETCGSGGQVIKLLPPLVLTDAELAAGLDILERAVLEVAHA
jgi:diaminobutyrate-2-oxoglutarate transaminase